MQCVLSTASPRPPKHLKSGEVTSIFASWGSRGNSAIISPIYSARPQRQRLSPHGRAQAETGRTSRSRAGTCRRTALSCSSGSRGSSRGQNLGEAAFVIESPQVVQQLQCPHQCLRGRRVHEVEVDLPRAARPTIPHCRMYTCARLCTIMRHTGPTPCQQTAKCLSRSGGTREQFMRWDCAGPRTKEGSTSMPYGRL